MPQVQEEIVGQALSQGVGMASKMKQSETPWFVLVPYYALCTLLDVVFENRCRAITITHSIA